MYVLGKNKKNIIIFQLKSLNFESSKNLCILHRQVFVMSISNGIVNYNELELELSWPCIRRKYIVTESQLWGCKNVCFK